MIRINDTWTGIEGANEEGVPFLVRIRPYLQNFIKTKKYKKRLDILWAYKSDKISLMPDEKDMKLMADV